MLNELHCREFAFLDTFEKDSDGEFVLQPVPHLAQARLQDAIAAGRNAVVSRQ